MWTSWLERTLGAHDAAEYAERRAERSEVELEAATSPSPLVGEGRGEGAAAATKNDRREPPHPPASRAPPSPARGEGIEVSRVLCC
jgi:hypothetical protein